MDDGFDLLPEDPELAFVYLVAQFRAKFESASAGEENGSAVAYHKMTYLNETIAAARALEIPGICDYELPSNENEIWDFARIVDRDLESLVVCQQAFKRDPFSAWKRDPCLPL